MSRRKPSLTGARSSFPSFISLEFVFGIVVGNFIAGSSLISLVALWRKVYLGVDRRGGGVLSVEIAVGNKLGARVSIDGDEIRCSLQG
jgi:hypothetical protein